MSRPTKYTKKLGERICSEIREGKSLRQISAPAEMPHKSTILRWRLMPSLKVFRDQYDTAIIDRTDAWAEQVIDIADDASDDYQTYYDEDDNEVTKLNRDHIQRSKLRVETRLKLMAKLAPKKYGDRLDLTSGDKPIETAVKIFSLTTAVKKGKKK